MTAKQIGRREFLRLFSLAGTAAMIAACQPTVVEKIVRETVVVEKEVEKEVERVITATPAPAVVADLEIWTYPRTENDAERVYEPMMEKFSELYPFIIPNVDVQTWGGRREKLYAACAAGEPPDIWFATTDTVPAYIEKGIILPLSDLLEAEALADYSESEIAAASYEGKLYMPLTDAEVNGFGYNGNLLRECGYDPETTVIETWDDIYALAEKAKAKGYYVEHLGTMDWNEWQVTVHEAGGTVYSADRTKCLMTEQPAIDSLTRWVKEYESGWVPLEHAVGNVDAQKGLPSYWLAEEQVTNRREDAACWRDTESAPNLDYIIGHSRHKTKDLPPISGQVSGQGWAITKLCEDKEAALVWVKFMIRPENIGLYNTLAGTTPVGTLAKKYWSTDPCVQLHISRFSPYLYSDQDSNTLWQESKVTCGPHLQAAVLGEATVEESLEAITKELDEILKEKHG